MAALFLLPLVVVLGLAPLCLLLLIVEALKSEPGTPLDAGRSRRE